MDYCPPGPHVRVAQVPGSSYVDVVMRIRAEAVRAIECHRHSEVIDPREGHRFSVAQVEHRTINWNVNV